MNWWEGLKDPALPVWVADYLAAFDRLLAGDESARTEMLDILREAGVLTERES